MSTIHQQRLKAHLEQARQLSEALLADFHTPEEWVHQVHASANHALWFAGHMAVTDNFFLSLAAPDKARDMADFQAHFGMGSQPTSKPGDYPPSEAVLAQMRERRGVLLAVLARLNDDDLSQPTPAGAPAFIRTIGDLFEMAVWHEGLHAGQVTVVRRALGRPPVLGG